MRQMACRGLERCRAPRDRGQRDILSATGLLLRPKKGPAKMPHTILSYDSEDVVESWQAIATAKDLVLRPEAARP
jgi:hypothetical protein